MKARNTSKKVEAMIKNGELEKVKCDEVTKKAVQSILEKLVSDKDNFIISFTKNVGSSVNKKVQQVNKERYFDKFLQYFKEDEIIGEAIDFVEFAIMTTEHIFCYQHEETRRKIKDLYNLINAINQGKLKAYWDRFEQYYQTYDILNEDLRISYLHYIQECYHGLYTLIGTYEKQLVDQFTGKKIKRITEFEDAVSEYIQIRQCYQIANLLYCQANIFEIAFSNNYKFDFIEKRRNDIIEKMDKAVEFLNEQNNQMKETIESFIDKQSERKLRNASIEKTAYLEKISDKEEFVKYYNNYLNALSVLQPTMGTNKLAFYNGEMYIQKAE